NFNAIVGRVRPGDLGIDAMHINLHKTFSTPHGGGGPGSGPVVLSEALSPYGPLPFTERYADGHADGLRQVAEDSVLNANYILRSLEDTLDAPFAGSGPCMHEAIFSDDGLPEGFSTIDIAKGLIDEGYHPMTMYFPLVVHGAMLVEPTETESKAALDQFIGALRSVAERAKAGDESLRSAPHFAPRRRLDETLAARKPVLVWKDPALAQAAE
ncbi:MAG: aminomethyl-transferring glycine dehydrogenase subunit GcvPB, partial [Sphingomonadales bacterium]|nr:aminomethyl-transferring glycine dehydrogenase subunit GcvPB [Sphingomonadales bacterium]